MTLAEYRAQFKITEEASRESNSKPTTVWTIREIAPGTMRHLQLLGSGLTEDAVSWIIGNAYNSQYQ